MRYIKVIQPIGNLLTQCARIIEAFAEHDLAIDAQQAYQLWSKVSHQQTVEWLDVTSLELKVIYHLTLGYFEIADVRPDLEHEPWALFISPYESSTNKWEVKQFKDFNELDIYRGNSDLTKEFWQVPVEEVVAMLRRLHPEEGD